MRCKPGDTAMIVHDYPDCMANVGMLVRVVNYGEDDCADGWLWEIESLGGPMWVRAEGGNPAFIDTKDIVHPDAWLSPIRHPGEDAVDETLRQLEHC